MQGAESSLLDLWMECSFHLLHVKLWASINLTASPVFKSIAWRSYAYLKVLMWK